MTPAEVDDMITTLSQLDMVFREMLSIIEDLAQHSPVRMGGYPSHWYCPLCPGTPTSDISDFTHKDNCTHLRSFVLTSR